MFGILYDVEDNKINIGIKANIHRGLLDDSTLWYTDISKQLTERKEKYMNPRYRKLWLTMKNGLKSNV